MIEHVRRLGADRVLVLGGSGDCQFNRLFSELARAMSRPFVEETSGIRKLRIGVGSLCNGLGKLVKGEHDGPVPFFRIGG